MGRGLSRKWNEIINTSIDIIKEFGHVKPTVRTILYRLDGLGLLNKSKKSDADALSQHLVDARKQGLIEWDALSDDARVLLGTVPEYQSPEEYLQSDIDHIKEAHKNYSYPRWYRQPHYVEVWVEKQALAGTFQSILRGKEVHLAVNRGFSSWTFFYHNAVRLENAIISKCAGEATLAHVLYFGDLDISGDDIVDHLDEMIEYFELKGIDFQKVAVDNASIKYHFDKMGVEYDGGKDKRISSIPAKPPKSSKPRQLNTWKRRLSSYRWRRGSDATIQLDGFLATDRKAFEKLVVGSVDKYFNAEIYREYQSKLREELKRIPSLTMEKVKELNKELNNE